MNSFHAVRCVKFLDPINVTGKRMKMIKLEKRHVRPPSFRQKRDNSVSQSPALPKMEPAMKNHIIIRAFVPVLNRQRNDCEQMLDRYFTDIPAAMRV